MSFKCHICPLVHVQDVRQICQYIYLIWTQYSNTVTITTTIHTFTLWAYAPEKIYLPHFTCMFHCTATVVHMWTPHYFIYKRKKTLYLSWYSHIYARSKYPPQMPHMSITSSVCMRQLCIHTSQAHDAINSLTRSTGIFAFNITGIWCWRNRPPIFHIYLPLHFYCTVYDLVVAQ